jgi:uncharacterized protein with HEPN domain
MLNKDIDILANIIEAISKIESYISQLKSAEELFNDSKTFDAVLMNIIVIGEMSAKLSVDFKISNPEIEWWKIKGLRNIVAHDYFGVDAEEIWQIIQNKIPNLKSFIQKIIK